MTNDKDLFSQINDLFEGVNVDEASELVGEEIVPSQEDYEKELINKLNNNEIELTDEVIDEVKKVIVEGGEVDLRITEFLRKRFEIEQEEKAQQQFNEEVVLPRDEAQPFGLTESTETPAEPAMSLDYIQNLAGDLSSFVKSKDLGKKSEAEVSDALTEKVEYLTNQLGIIRQTLDEQGKSIVSGIGQGGDGQTPGSGEVRLQKQDDVDMDGIKPGQTLCWDPDMYSGTGGWYPCDGGGGGGGGGTIQPATQGAVFGCNRVKDCADLYWGSKDDYDTWYNGGAVDGDLSATGAKLVQAGIRGITGCIAVEYQPSGTYPGASESDNWFAVGATDCDGNILDTDAISTEGTSSLVGPEGYFLVYENPDDCGETLEGCDPTAVDYKGCSPVLPIDENNNPDGYTNELRYGDDADVVADPQGGVAVEDENGPIEGITAILAITFEGCDKDTMEGKYNVYYQTDTGIKIASYVDDQIGAENRSFFIANANCDTTVEPPEEQEQLIGCLAAEGCKEVDDDPTQIGQIKFGDPNGDSEDVRDDSGTLVDDAQKLLFVVTKKDESYTIDDVTGEIDAVWILTYQDFSGNTKQVEHEGVIDVTTCEVGFFIESDNDCLNPGTEEPEEGDKKPWPGLITGCKEIDTNLLPTGGNLMWGNETTSQSALGTLGDFTSVVTDAVQILFVFSVDPAVNETDKFGLWQCLYKNIAGEYKLAYPPSGPNSDGSAYGFFIETSDDAQCVDDSTEQEFKYGIFTGCRKPVVPGELYWGTVQEAAGSGPHTIVNDINGDPITDCRVVYRPFTVNNSDYFGVYIKNLSGIPFVALVENTSSPINGFYTLGDCKVEDGDDSCPTDEKIYSPPMGCREVAAPGTDLLFGTETTAEVVDTEVTKILSVYTEDLCDNNYGVWQCVYVKLVNGNEDIRIAEKSGFNPADPVEDSESFYLDTTNVECLEDPDSIEGGKPINGIITGCRRTLESAGTTLHWGDGTDTSEIVKDTSGNDVTDAKFILANVSLNADATKFGHWICLFQRADGSFDTSITYGQSPTDGYFLEGSNCDPDDCRDGSAYFGFLPDCNEADPNFDPGELYWNNGDDSVPNTAVVDGGTQVLARKVLATFTLDNCDKDFDITADQEWYALYFAGDGKLSVTGTQTGKSPMGGYYLEVDDVNSFCAYEYGGFPEGPCADGCPPGYECFMGICRLPCDPVDGSCPPLFECNDPPGGCWPQVCSDDTDCGPDGICVDGRCRQICNDTKPCPDGYNCVEILPGVSVCLPITIDPEGPEQPTEPGPESHPPVGCEQVDKCGTLYWGSEEDYVNGTGELQQDVNGPIKVRKIDLITATDIYPNGFATFTVYYRTCDTDAIEIHTVQKQSPVGGMLQSFYIKPDDDAICINFGETTDPYFGLIAGCKETDRGGTIHWGTIAEGISDNYPNPPLIYPDGTQIIAKGIMTVFSINSVPAADGVGQTGIWNIFYQLLDGTIEYVEAYGTSGPQGPEGAFMRAGTGSICIDSAFDLTTTRDVILVNSPRVMTTRNQFLGDGPQGTADITGPNGEIIRYETQEQANLLNLDLLTLLDNRKPTVHVVEDINTVIGNHPNTGYYCPQRGDLWIDPSDYSIYVCDFDIAGRTPNEILSDPERYLLWIELGAASGGGDGGSSVTSGNNVYLQDAKPSDSLVKKGDLWIDAETYLMYVYNSSAESWISVTGDIKAVLDNKFEVHIDNEKPDPKTTKSGDLWFDSEVAEMRVAYIPDGSTSLVWVPVQGTGHKAIPSTTSFGADEVRALQDQISRLSERLALIEDQQT